MDRISAFLLISWLCLAAGASRAEQALVAVAANFLTTAERLAQVYEAETGHEIVVAHGSTGRLYAQIVSGAPFDVFLSADTARPERLAAEGLAEEWDVVSIGVLVLVTRDPLDDIGDALRGERVALANPDLAPFGAAAHAALEAAGLGPDDYQPIYGDSVAQAASHFVAGSVDAAFVALSQVRDLGDGVISTEITSDDGLLSQGAVLLAASADNPAARGFYDFLYSEAARGIIADSGYWVPG